MDFKETTDYKEQLKSYQCELCFQNCSNYPHDGIPDKTFKENICDIAHSLAEIMIICGMHECKAKATFDIIIHAFMHYDEQRHHFDEHLVKREGISKITMIREFRSKCLMTRMEAELAWLIIKRAFKAFYHGTTERSIRNPIIEAQVIHAQENMWKHAATRTVHIYAKYEGNFYNAERNWERLIKQVYQNLYERLKLRASIEIPERPACKKSAKRIIPGILPPTKPQLPKTCREIHEAINACDRYAKVMPLKNVRFLKCDMSGFTEPKVLQERPPIPAIKYVEHKPSNISLHLPRCYKCQRFKHLCECLVDNKTGCWSVECSQGPFRCTWVRVRKTKYRCRTAASRRAHVCPVDCPNYNLDDICAQEKPKFKKRKPKIDPCHTAACLEIPRTPTSKRKSKCIHTKNYITYLLNPQQ